MATNKLKKMLLVFMIFFLVGGCFLDTKNEKLKDLASSLQKVADECLHDVRDKGLKYEESSNCSALGALAKMYIAAGGWEDLDLVAEHARIANGALTTAWMARAISASGNPLIKIW